MPPVLKPPARARPAPAFVRFDRVAVSAHAIEAMFAQAEVLAEGGLDDDERWYGSVMITFDLAQLRRRVRGLALDDDLARFVALIEGSVRVRVRAHRMACAEVYRRYPDRSVGTAQIESAFRREGDLLLMDIDVEVPIAQARLREGLP